jgi:Zn-dependent peptidase ImmA (M78 family)
MSVLAEIRNLMPRRPLSDDEAKSLAERQAARFLQLSGITEPHVPGSIVAELPRIAVEVRPDVPASGLTYWDKTSKVWRIHLKASDVAVRQRFSLLHEFKHVLDDPVIDFAYPSTGLVRSSVRAERICDYFAACVLMPRPWVKRAWGIGVQEVSDLADLFGVSQEAMARRLSDLGLRASPYRNRYFRQPTDEAFVYFRTDRRLLEVSA